MGPGPASACTNTCTTTRDRRADLAPVDSQPHAEGPDRPDARVLPRVWRRRCAGAGTGRRRIARPDAHRKRHHVRARRRYPGARTRTRASDRSPRSPHHPAHIDLTLDRRREPHARTARRTRRSPGLPFVRPARPPLERGCGGSSCRASSACSPTGRSSRSSSFAWPNGSASRTSSRLSSCTSGLMLVVQALTDGRAGPVVVPSFTFSASAHAVMWNGARRFVDCLPARSRSTPTTPPPTSTARAPSWRHTCSARRATSRPSRRWRGPASRWSSTPHCARRASTAPPSARSETPKCSASRPPSRSSPARAGCRTNDGAGGGAAHRARLRQPRRLRHALRGSQRTHVGVPRRDGARVAAEPR